MRFFSQLLSSQNAVPKAFTTKSHATKVRSLSLKSIRQDSTSAVPQMYNTSNEDVSALLWNVYCPPYPERLEDT